MLLLLLLLLLLTLLLVAQGAAKLLRIKVAWPRWECVTTHLLWPGASVAARELVSKWPFPLTAHIRPHRDARVTGTLARRERTGWWTIAIRCIVRLPVEGRV